MRNELKILKSYKQSVLEDTATKDKIYKGEKIITIEDDKFSIELPKGGVLTGTLTPQAPQDGMDTYLTDKGCPVAISNEKLFINLYRSHNMACTFHLGEAPSNEGKSWFRKIFGS
jgi:hypothetical protein